MEGEGKIFIGNKIMISTLTDLIEGLECKPKLILQKIKHIDKYFARIIHIMDRINGGGPTFK